MAQMCTAGIAHDLGSRHAVAAIGFFLDVIALDGLVETRPAAAGFIFRVGVKEFGAAAGTGVDTFIFRGVVLAGEGTFGSFHAADHVPVSYTHLRAHETGRN